MVEAVCPSETLMSESKARGRTTRPTGIVLVCLTPYELPNEICTLIACGSSPAASLGYIVGRISAEEFAGMEPSSKVFWPILTAEVLPFAPFEGVMLTTTPVAPAVPLFVIEILTWFALPGTISLSTAIASSITFPVTLNGTDSSAVRNWPTSRTLEYATVSGALYPCTPAEGIMSTSKNNVKEAPGSTIESCEAIAWGSPVDALKPGGTSSVPVTEVI